MRELNNQNQHEFLLAKEVYGIDLDPIRKEYGAIFAIRVFKSFFYKGTRKLKPSPKINLKTPGPKKLKGNLVDFTNLLNSCGFSIKFETWPEDFIDEDIGEVVTIQRFKFKKINPLKETTRP